jgi:F-type H+-transporting ATPase subunit b
MDKTLHDLGAILLKAVPTFVLLLLLNAYLNAVFFKPLKAVLQKRREATDGAREAAEAGQKAAAERAAEYDAKLRDARAVIYREQEEMRKRWLAEQTQHVEEAHQKTRELVQTAKHQLDQELAFARRELSQTASDLADQITNTLLERRVN